jgi:hypothetical protein
LIRFLVRLPVFCCPKNIEQFRRKTCASGASERVFGNDSHRTRNVSSASLIPFVCIWVSSRRFDYAGDGTYLNQAAPHPEMVNPAPERSTWPRLRILSESSEPSYCRTICCRAISQTVSRGHIGRFIGLTLFIRINMYCCTYLCTTGYGQSFLFRTGKRNRVGVVTVCFLRRPSWSISSDQSGMNSASMLRIAIRPVQAASTRRRGPK